MLTQRLRRMRGALLLVVLMAGPVTLGAQQANVGGRVLDSSGGALPGVTVTATNADTGIRTVATSNEEGHYALALLPPGRYTLTAELAGFQTQTRTDITLSVQQFAQLDFELGAASSSD